MKALALGLLVTMAVVAVVLLLLREQADVSRADVRSIDSTIAGHQDSTAVTSVEEAPERRDPEPGAAAALPEVSDADPAAENWDAPCECAGAWFRRKEELERAAREAEPKDTNWAYDMEQLLEQYIASHPQAAAIQITGIECRTTYCKIEAAAHADSPNSFEDVLRQARDEPWSTFGGRRRISSDPAGDGRLVYRAFIYRAPIPADYSPPATSEIEEACACATPEWRRRKMEHEAAVRAAEPKDLSWAYATEPRLHRYIAADPRAVAFEVSSIDCRTTYCEIKAIGLTDESTDLFRKIIREMVVQEQFEFTQEMQSGASHYDDRAEIHARVTRKR